MSPPMTGVPSSWILNFGELLDEKGVSSEQIFRRCGIDPDLVSDTEARIHTDPFDGFCPKAGVRAGDA